MKHLIDKDALVAEIENRIKKYTKRGEESDAKRDGYGMYWGGVLSCLNEVRTLCDTFETKDVDGIIKNAEDHAYFAGSENTREKLINEACKWWEDELSYPSMTPDEIKWYKSKVRKFRKAMEDE